MPKQYKARSGRPGKTSQANPVIGAKKKTKHRTYWSRPAKQYASDDIPEPLPDGISRGSLYIAPEQPKPVPLAEMELPYCVPNAKKLRRAIRAAKGVIEPRKTIRRKNPTKKHRGAKRAPVASTPDRAAILAELRSRKATQ